MFQINFVVFLLFEFAIFGSKADTNSVAEVLKTGGRQKRLLFYDEDGNLVKTFKNPYLYDTLHNAEKVPLLASLFNPFLSLRPSTYSGPTAYMIPVSEEVIQQINKDPVYQNKFFTIPRKELVMAPNGMCAQKRTQMPTENCKNFLNCWDGWAVEQECPEGLLFSREGFCDYPHNVDCNNRDKKPESSDNLSELPPIQNIPSIPSQNIPPAAINLPDANPPSQNLPPQNLPPQNLPPQNLPPQNLPPQNLPPQNLPPQNLPPQNLPPQNEPPQSLPPPNLPPQTPPPQNVPPSSQNTPESPDQPTPQCNSDFETFRSQWQCSEFFVCVNKVPVKFKCPADLAYNEQLGVCDYNYRVDCSSSLSTMSEPVKPTPCAGASEGAGSLVSDPKPNVKNILSNAVFDTRNWLSTLVAISRQDAIRQLKLSGIANVKV